MSCLTGASPVWAAGNLPQSDQSSPVAATTEAYFDSLPGIIITQLQLSCADAKAYAKANLIPPFSVIRNGTVIPVVTSGMMSLQGTAPLGASGEVQVDGASVGTWSDGSFGYAYSAGTYTAGGNMSQSWQMNAEVLDGGTSGILFAIPVTAILMSFDFDTWWCCASAAYNCCGGGGGSHVGSFLIPPSSNPDPVAAQSTTPILNTPLYLSNHTFALPNNFGSKK